MRAEIVPATAAHVEALAARPRQADIDELWAQAKSTPRSALEYGLAKSTLVFTGLVDGVPLLMFGVVPYNILAGYGNAWMVGSADLDASLRHQKALLLRSRDGLAALHRQFPLLFNSVDDRNDAAKRWLAWLGFTLMDPVPLGHEKRPFRPFFRYEAPNV